MSKPGLVVAAVIAGALHCSGFGLEPPPHPARQTVSLNGDWLFRRDGAETDDWKAIRVPSSFEEHEGVEFDGAGWYRKNIAPFPVPAGKRVLLDVDLHLRLTAKTADRYRDSGMVLSIFRRDQAAVDHGLRG